MRRQTDNPSSRSQGARPRRRWYQFSIGSMLVLLTVAAIGSAYWRSTVMRYERQTAPAEAIAKLGGTITWEPTVPAWLRWLPLAEDCKKVVGVNLQDCSFEEGDLRALVKLPDIERLYLARSSIRDGDLEYVGKLGKLRRLSLWRTGISNKGLRQLEALAELRVLDVHANGSLDERLLECLSRWPKLGLLIQDFPVTDRGLALLAAHPNVPVTALHASQVSDQGLEDLIRLRRLETLTVSLECERKKMMRLTWLQQLTRLTALGRLELPTQQLRAAMPKLKDVQTRRLTEVRFSELADRWGKSCQALEIHGTYPWHTDTFNRYPIHVTLVQRKPTVKIDAELKDVTWEDIPRFRKVESVTIEGNGFDSAQLVHLQELPLLKKLCLRISLNSEAMRRIAQLRRLEHLHLTKYRVGSIALDPDSCDPLSALAELRTFTVVVTRMRDRLLAFLSSCSKLRCVGFYDIGITGETFKHLSELPCLEELVVVNCHQLRNEDLEQLKTFKNLRICWVHGGYIHRSVLDSVHQSLPLLQNDPSRRKKVQYGFSHTSFRNLPMLHDGKSRSTRR